MLLSNAGKQEARKVGPIAKIGGITSDADELSDGGRGTVKNKHHVPPRRSNVSAGRGGQGACLAAAAHLWKEGSLPHCVSVGRDDAAEEGDFRFPVPSETVNCAVELYVQSL